jgi:hypothetical protein
MLNYTKLITYGCSLTKDNYIDTWASHLSRNLTCVLENYAERGAGYAYIVQKILSNPIPDKDHLTVIMWPSADRLDLYVNSATPHLQTDVDNASWLDGKSASFVDYDGVYNEHAGWYINGAVPRGYKNIYYKYFYNQTTFVNQAWSCITAIQHYFNSIDRDYVMCNSYPLENLIQYHADESTDFNYHLYNKIDLTKFVKNADKSGFIDIVKTQQFKLFNPHYPATEAHKWYVDNYIMPALELTI